MKPKGLGDDIEKFTKATGIKNVVDKVAEGLSPAAVLLVKNGLIKNFHIDTNGF
jgi:hypothetical protein